MQARCNIIEDVIRPMKGGNTSFSEANYQGEEFDSKISAQYQTADEIPYKKEILKAQHMLDEAEFATDALIEGRSSNEPSDSFTYEKSIIYEMDQGYQPLHTKLQGRA